MNWFARQTIHHADTERGQRILGTALADEEAKGLFDERVITLLEREIPRVSGDGRPEPGRGIDGYGGACTPSARAGFPRRS